MKPQRKVGVSLVQVRLKYCLTFPEILTPKIPALRQKIREDIFIFF